MDFHPEKKARGLRVGFRKEGAAVLTSANEEFQNCTYQWFLNGSKEKGSSIYYSVKSTEPFPFEISCKVTNTKEFCYSVYDTIVTENAKQMDIMKIEKISETFNDGNANATKIYQLFMEHRKVDIFLHPNPAYSGVQVKVEGICEMDPFTIECYSPQGRLLFRQKAKGDSFSFPTDNYVAGVYIVKIQLAAETFPIVKKLIIL